MWISPFREAQIAIGWVCITSSAYWHLELWSKEVEYLRDRSHLSPGEEGAEDFAFVEIVLRNPP